MSQFIQLFKNMSPASSPGSPASTTKKEGRFKKFKRNLNKSPTSSIIGGSNLSKQRSVSTSALTQMDPIIMDIRFSDNQRRNSVSIASAHSTRTLSQGSDDSLPVVSEPKNQLSVKELIEKMILHLQVLERKNEILSHDLQQISEEKNSLESELSSTKVELNLYKNRLIQIEKICDEWHCSICMDNKFKIVNTKRVIVSTMCGHLFCSTCAQTFMSSNRQTKHCPTCHKPLKEGQTNYHPIFI